MDEVIKADEKAKNSYIVVMVSSEIVGKRLLRYCF